MCVSMYRADFTGTLACNYRTDHPVHGRIDVLAYSNTAVNLNPGPNAMILHIPATTLSQNNFIHHNCPSLLLDMKKAVTPIDKGLTRGSLGDVQVFNYGIYTVLLGKSLFEIEKHLDEVEVKKRPTLSKIHVEYYTKAFPTYSFALFCFNNRDALEATPILLWYNSFYMHQIIPGLDAHDGSVPRSGRVNVDHWLFWASDYMQIGSSVNYSDQGAHLIDSYLPPRVIGGYYNGSMVNGDFALTPENVNAGLLDRMTRLQPAYYKR